MALGWLHFDLIEYAEVDANVPQFFQLEMDGGSAGVRKTSVLPPGATNGRIGESFVFPVGPNLFRNAKVKAIDPRTGTLLGGFNLDFDDFWKRREHLKDAWVPLAYLRGTGTNSPGARVRVRIRLDDAGVAPVVAPGVEARGRAPAQPPPPQQAANGPFPPTPKTARSRHRSSSRDRDRPSSRDPSPRTHYAPPPASSRSKKEDHQSMNAVFGALTEVRGGTTPRGPLSLQGETVAIAQELPLTNRSSFSTAITPRGEGPGGYQPLRRHPSFETTPRVHPQAPPPPPQAQPQAPPPPSERAGSSAFKAVAGPRVKADPAIYGSGMPVRYTGEDDSQGSLAREGVRFPDEGAGAGGVPDAQRQGRPARQAPHTAAAARTMLDVAPSPPDRQVAVSLGPPSAAPPAAPPSRYAPPESYGRYGNGPPPGPLPEMGAEEEEGLCGSLGQCLCPFFTAPSPARSTASALKGSRATRQYQYPPGQPQVGFY